MGTSYTYKEVDYFNYCKKCKHWESKMTDEPCNECLCNPCMPNSKKPMKFEDRDKED